MKPGPQKTARPQEKSGFSVLEHSPGKQMMSMTPMSPIVGRQRSESCPASPMTRPASPMTHDARPKNLTAVNPASPMLLPISPMPHNAQSKSRAGVNPKAGIRTSSPMDKPFPYSPTVMKSSPYNPKEWSRVYGFGMRISVSLSLSRARARTLDPPALSHTIRSSLSTSLRDFPCHLALAHSSNVIDF